MSRGRRSRRAGRKAPASQDRRNIEKPVDGQAMVPSELQSGKADNKTAADQAENHKSGDRRRQDDGKPPRRRRRPVQRFAAIDLGTNNCRLLIATPRGHGFRIVDAFSRIVRLGEGVGRTGDLSEEAMDRTVEAIRICAQKIERRGVTAKRCIATQACRAAGNGDAFLKRVEEETGLALEVISTEEEARLAALGCRDLIDTKADAALVFDIGGGSTEISFLRVSTDEAGERGISTKPDAWFSIPIGVVNLSEKWGGREISPETYKKIVAEIAKEIRRFGDPAELSGVFAEGRGHLLGTSGTVTSIAGVHLGLERYRRDIVDGLWLDATEAHQVTEDLIAMSYEERAEQPCIGRERADLVVCGCAILDAIQSVWPSSRIRVADRGLREGILVGLARDARRKSRRRRRRRSRNRKSANNDKPQVSFDR